MRKRRRRVEQSAKAAIGRVGRDDRRGGGGAEDRDQQSEAETLHFTRGSTNASAASDISVPTARKIDPAAAQPATRYTSRARSAPSISCPSPGHAVTVSTAKDPLS